MNLFVFDMDGTLLTSSREILEENINAIIAAKEKGHSFAIASGRSHISIKEVIGKAFSKFANPFDYYICNNGSYVYDTKSENTHIMGEIDQDLIMPIIEYAEELGNSYLIHAHSSETAYFFENKKNDSDILGKDPEEINTFSLNELKQKIRKMKVVQIGFIIDPKDNPTMFNMFKEKFGDILSITLPGKKFIDINHPGVHKYKGVEFIKNKLGIAKNNIVSFGDANNDLEMIKLSNKGIAMGNATDEIKNIADEVIGSNDEPSIANFLNYYI